MNTVTLDTPKNTIAAVPSLIGHYPKDSVVVMFLDENKLALTSRMEADESLASEEHLWQFVSRVCASNGFTSVIVIHFGDMVDAYSQSVAYLSERCDQEEGPALIDALIVDPEGNYRSIDSDAESGKITRDDYQTSAVSIGYIVEGAQIAESRDDIVAELQMSKRTNKIHKEATAIATGLRKSKEKIIDYRWAAYHFSAAVLDDPSPDVIDVLALGVMAQEDVKVRDAIVYHIVKSSDPRAIRAKLVQGLRHMPERQAPAMLTIMGVSSYVYGDAMRAGIAAEKCLEIDGNYALAQLMDAAIQRSVPPNVWGELVSSMTIEEVLL
jgi:hypothetical protein